MVTRPAALHRHRLIATCLFAGLLLAGCGRSEPPPDAPETPPPGTDATELPSDPRRGGTLRIGLPALPVSLDPGFVADEEGELIAAAVFEPLVLLDEQLRARPGAAASWEILDDGAAFRFVLRAQAQFHDGTPVTAEDFKRAFDRIADGSAEQPSYLAFLLEPVQGIEQAQDGGVGLSGVVVEDEHTLRIDLNEPMPRFLATLAHPALVPVPSMADEDPEAFAARPVGNGPFELVEAPEGGSFVRLARVDDHRRAPLVDEVLLSIYPDDPAHQQQWDDLRDGQLHVATVAPARREAAAEAYGSSPDGYAGPGLLDGTRSTVYMYGFDVTRAPFDDVRVRRAVSLAIDRQRLADVTMQRTRLPADSIVPGSIPGGQAGVCEYCRHDPQEARTLWEEAAPDVDGLTLNHNRGAAHAAIAEQIAADVEGALGVPVDLQADDLQDFIQGVRRGELPLFRLGWEPTEPEPGSYLHPLFHSDQVGLDNLTRFADDDVDALLDEARRALAVGSALARYREAEALILDEMPVVPLLHYRLGVVVAPVVDGFRWPAFGLPDLTEVWLQGG